MRAAPDPSLLERFKAALAGRAGLRFEADRHGVLIEALLSRSEATRCAPEEYVARLAEGGADDELAALATSITVGETYFLRHGRHFEALRSIAASDPVSGGSLRVLSAGCASGEEVYTIAMVLADVLPAGNWSVLGVDINRAVLERARQGRYTAWSLREVPPSFVERWFHRVGKEFSIDPALRRRVSFAQGNLAEDDDALFGESRYDVIFCRNVLMYFTFEKLREAVARLQRALAPGGYLFLGSAETLRGVNDELELCQGHGGFYYRRPPSSARDEPRRRQESARAQESWMDAIERSAVRIGELARRGDRPATEPRPDGMGPDLRVELELLEREQFALALARLRDLPPELAQHPRALLLRAVLLVSSGAVSEAEATCQHLLAEDELNAGAHFVLGLCAAALGRNDAAAREHRIATHLDPTFGVARLHLGQILRRSGERAAARAELALARTLLEGESSERLALFGGGFGRGALLDLCDAELALAAGGRP